MTALQSYFGKIKDVSKSIAVDMGMTWKYLVDPKEIVTVQYGSEKYAPQENYIPERHRGIHFLETEKCIQCNICAKACPVDCIEMEGTRDGDLVGAWQGDKVQISRFVIDLNKCIFCNLCCEPCPKQCIHMGQEFDLAGYTRSNGVKNLLTDAPYSEEDEKSEAWRRDEMKRLKEEKKKAKEAEKAAKAAAKAAAEKKNDDDKSDS